MPAGRNRRGQGVRAVRYEAVATSPSLDQNAVAERHHKAQVRMTRLRHGVASGSGSGSH